MLKIVQKAILLLLSILPIQPSLYAQNSIYHPFLAKNAVWLYTSQGIEGYENSKYNIIGDSIINKITYKKIEGHLIEIQGINTTPTRVGRLETLSVREDLATKKVYRLYENNDDEVLEYDFSLMLGQKCPSNDRFIVSRIDTIKLVAGERKRITFTAINESPIVWIEGIGNISNPFIPDAIVQESQILLCNYQNNRIVYDKGKVLNVDCTALITATSEKELQIYPNPTTGNIRISAPNIAIADIYLIDLLGRVIFTSLNTNLSSTYTMSIANVPVGTYIVLVKSKEDLLLQKIQKQM